MVWRTLEDHFQVVYGAALALAIVVLLTPAVGGMARLLGVVDQPDGRRINRRTPGASTTPSTRAARPTAGVSRRTIPSASAAP